MSFRAFLSQTRASFAALTAPMIDARSSIMPSPPSAVPGQIRCASNLGPRRTKYRKAQKGRVPFPTGGSVKGTTVTQGVYGLRALDPSRIPATQLTAAETALKRKLIVVRGSQVFMRVFPDIPFCVKGNETRMGKGKGSFEYWACRYVNCFVDHLQAISVPVGRVIFEIGGHVEIRPEVAKDGTSTHNRLTTKALRLAAAKLPIRTEFITSSTPPRLGREVSHELHHVKPAGMPRLSHELDPQLVQKKATDMRS